MDIRKAELMALTQMKAHGLLAEGWTFKWANGKRQFGYTYFGPKTIALSKQLTQINDHDAVLDTILHEVAHALAGFKAGHGEEWKRVARKLGCSATRTMDFKTPEEPWQGVCPACGHTAARFRKPDPTLACSICCKGTWNADFIFEWKHNGKRVVLYTPDRVG